MLRLITLVARRGRRSTGSMRLRRGDHAHDGRAGRDAGMATAEFAMAMPAVALVLAVVVGLGQLLLTQQRAWHAASVAARLAARGESDDVVRSAARSSGAAFHVDVTRDSQWVRVHVTASSNGVVGLVLPDVHADVTAAREIADQGSGS